MRPLAVFAAIAAALVTAGAASAGGWATVGLSSLPDGTPPGKPWDVEITILQHGRTPLADISPSVTIRNQSTGEELVHVARATDRVGIYRARVIFPTAGIWSYEVYDGFTQYGGAQTHTFAPVTIGAAAGLSAAARPGASEAALPAGAGRSQPGAGATSPAVWPVAGGIAGALALCCLAAFRRRRRPRPSATLPS